MARITTLTAMKNYIKMNLGAPINCVQITEDQLEMVIEDCVQVFQKYHTGEGNYQDYIGFTVSAGVSAYSLSGLEAVADIDFSFSDPNGINVLFSPQHQILYQDWVVFGNYPGGPSSEFGGASTGMRLSQYEIASEYLEDVKDMFQTIFYGQYSKARQELMIIPTPRITGTGMLQVYKQEQASNLYNNDLVKRLCIAKAKMIWASNFGVVSMALPGGGTIEKSELKQEGKEEWEKAFEDMTNESETPLFYID